MGVCVNLCRVSEQLELALLRHWRVVGCTDEQCEKSWAKSGGSSTGEPRGPRSGGSGPIRVYAYEGRLDLKSLLRARPVR